MLIEKLKEKLTVNYDSLKPYPNGALAPRLGYYLIQSIEYRTIGELEIPIAKALWSNESDYFVEGDPIEIQCFSLYQATSIARTSIDRDELPGKIIVIIESEILQQVNDRGHRYRLTWDVVYPLMPILSSQQLFFKQFFSASSSFTQAIESFRASQPSHVVDILDQIDDMGVEDEGYDAANDQDDYVGDDYVEDLNDYPVIDDVQDSDLNDNPDVEENK